MMDPIQAHGNRRFRFPSMQKCMDYHCREPAMNWDDVRIFLAIAREGSLGAAARVVGQTQPTMGRRLRALEAAIASGARTRDLGGVASTREFGAAVVTALRAA